MKKVFALSFFTLGFTSLLAQVTLIRELVVSFYGNEFFIGWILFSWLFWTGMGSLVLGRLFSDELSIRRATVACHLLAGILFPAAIVIVRSGKTLLGTFPGEIPNLLPALVYCFAALSVFCLVLGFQFAAGSRYWTLHSGARDVSRILGSSYWFETVGFIAGGILFSYGLVFLNEFLTCSCLAALNGLCAFLIILTNPEKKKISAVCLLAALLVLCALMTAKRETINRKTQGLRFPSEELLYSKNSVYGNIAVTRMRGQISFYENGLLLGPERDELSSEHLVHFPMLAHPSPRKVLLIGTGFNGPLKEVLKYDPALAVNVELDPELIQTAAPFLPRDLAGALKDPRVRIYTGDSRYFLNESREKFDCIIVNLPNPSTALINRLFTEEFYKKLRLHLEPGGLVAAHLGFSPNYLKPELGDLAASIYRSMKEYFPVIQLLPEDTLFFLAFPDRNEAVKPAELIRNLRERRIQTHFVTAPYIEYRFTNDRVSKMTRAILENKTARSNRDAHPQGYYYNFVYWTSFFSLPTAHFLSWLNSIPYYAVVLTICALAALASFFLRGGMEGARYAWAMATSGFSLLGAEVAIIYAYQITFGNLYYKISWIITMLMAGMAVGTACANRILETADRRTLVRLHLLEAGFFLAVLAFLWLIFQSGTRNYWLAETLFLGLAVFAGSIVGFEFPTINRIYLAGEKAGHMKTGFFYGADLFGSSIGAVLVSVFMIPIYGLFRTLLLLCVLNLAAVLVLLGKNLGRKDV